MERNEGLARGLVVELNPVAERGVRGAMSPSGSRLFLDLDRRRGRRDDIGSSSLWKRLVGGLSDVVIVGRDWRRWKWDVDGDEIPRPVGVDGMSCEVGRA